jgi:hypothetical protein
VLEDILCTDESKMMFVTCIKGMDDEKSKREFEGV